MPVLMDARQLEAVTWLMRYAHEHISGSLTQQGLAPQLLGLPENHEQQMIASRNSNPRFFAQNNLPLQQAVVPRDNNPAQANTLHY